MQRHHEHPQAQQQQYSSLYYKDDDDNNNNNNNNSNNNNSNNETVEYDDDDFETQAALSFQDNNTEEGGPFEIEGEEEASYSSVRGPKNSRKSRFSKCLRFVVVVAVVVVGLSSAVAVWIQNGSISAGDNNMTTNSNNNNNYNESALPSTTDSVVVASGEEEDNNNDDGINPLSYSASHALENLELGPTELWKKAWPEVVGLPGTTAKEIIMRENPTILQIFIVYPNDGTIISMTEYRMDRIRIFVDETGTVTRTPHLG